jgi:Delta7-sterol 5-desaturase
MHDHTNLWHLISHLGPVILTFDSLRYAIAAVLMFMVVQGLKRTGWASRQLQVRVAGFADYQREILASVRTVFVFAVVGIFTVWASANGWMPHKDSARLDWTLLPSLLGMILAHDTYFYWTHRAMHHRRLFRFFHRTHHRSVTPTPFAAYAFDLPEAVVQAAFLPLWLAVVPTANLVIFLFLAFMITRNVMGHAGLELHGTSSGGWVDHPMLQHINTTTHHDLHHSGGFNTNYGLYFTWWDRLMGTEHPAYRATYRRAVSVRELDAKQLLTTIDAEPSRHG